MANYDVQVVLKHENGLPEDVYINTLHFEVNAPDTLNGLADDIASAYDNVLSILNDCVSGMDVKIYDSGPNPGGPTYSESYGYEPTAGPGPQELACCLSYATVDDPQASTPRRRGRIYVGPLGGSVVQTDLINTTVQEAVRNLGIALGAAGTAGNTTWLMKSATDNSYHKIESIWVDDAYDIQRRRGLRPTSRMTFDVQ